MLSNRSLKIPVLLLGGGDIALAATRHFGKNGVAVYTVAQEKADIAFRSRYCKKKYLTSRQWGPNSIKKVLRKIAKQMTDLCALYLSRVMNELPDDYFFIVGNPQATEILVNKQKFYQTLEKNRVEYPYTLFPESIDDINRIKDDLTYPVFVRPNITELFVREFGLQKGFVANSPRELVRYFKLTVSRKVRVMVQEIISGPPTNSVQLEGYYNKEFLPVGFFARQRLKIYPSNFGNTTLCISVPLSTFARKRTEIDILMKGIGYNGLASAELKLDPKDNVFRFLEINCRLWRHFWHSTDCGVNLLLLSYLDAIGEEIEYATEYTEGVKSLYPFDDLRFSAKMILNSGLKLKDWFSLMRGKQHSTLFDKNDPSPSFFQYAFMLSQVFKQRN